MKFDMLVSNPPYIAQADLLNLMPEVRDFEPVGALDGGVDGLDFYRRISDLAPEYLKENGLLFFEIGCDQAYAVQRIMAERGFFELSVVKDLAGLDRVVRGRLKGK